MRSLMQLAEEASSTPLSEQDIDWLHLLLADWQVLADLAAADLVLWLPTDDGRFIAAAHCRPATSTTVHVDDIIGLYLPAAREIDLRRALQTGQVVRSPAARWAGTYSMMETCVPVCHDGRIIAVVTREANLSSPRLSLGFEGWTRPRRLPPTASRESSTAPSCWMRRAASCTQPPTPCRACVASASART